MGEIIKRLKLIKNAILGRPIMYKFRTYKKGTIKPKGEHNLVIDCEFDVTHTPSHPNCRCITFLKSGSIGNIKLYKANEDERTKEWEE